MDVTEKKKEKLHREYHVNVTNADYQRHLDKHLAEVSKKVKIPGFRPGKVPPAILQKRYEDAVKQDVLKDIVSEALEKIYKDFSVKPALSPDIKLGDMRSDEKVPPFDVSFDILPDVPPIDLKTVKLERLKADVADEKVKEDVDKFRKRVSKTKPIDDERPTQKGDVVLISFQGTCEGKPIEGGSGKDVRLELGSNQFVDTFEDQLVGKKVGDHVDVKVTFPKDYEEELAGKKGEFSVDITGIHAYEEDPEDKILLKALDLKSMDDLTNMIRGYTEKEYDRMSFLVAKRAVLDELAKISFDIPDSLYEMEFKAIWDHYLQVQKSESTDSKDEEKLQKEQEKDKKQYQDLAKRRVRLGLILAEIGKEFDVRVTKEELESALLSTIRRYPGEEKQVYEYFKKNPSAMANLRAPIFEDKVVNVILDKASVTEKKVTPEELGKAAKDVTEGDEDMMES